MDGRWQCLCLGAPTSPSATTTLRTTAGECTLPVVLCASRPLRPVSAPARRLSATSVHGIAASAPGGRCWLSDGSKIPTPPPAFLGACTPQDLAAHHPPTARAALTLTLTLTLILRPTCARVAAL
ncbi:hypothetical protein E8E12_010230 [Didymella heteroderae]|uniref:Uncharacterized protein n=1 Tax=Didymella heteroderae TaxID=1769908 RepID=A0A9P4WY02_9PLEO|nr:hypothetical protein E8E12_010230 [Didymella heteroderae]